MKDFTLALLLLCCLALMVLGCDKGKEKSITQFEIINESCNLKNPIKFINESMGSIQYSDRAKAYCIFTSIEGTYDSVNVGVICNLPESYKKDGIKVLYSGNYFKYDVNFTLFPGETFYHQELSKIRLVENL